MEVLRRGPKFKYDFRLLKEIGDSIVIKDAPSMNVIRESARRQGYIVAQKSIVGGGFLVILKGYCERQR